jgi:hypothetical protein
VRPRCQQAEVEVSALPNFAIVAIIQIMYLAHSLCGVGERPILPEASDPSKPEYLAEGAIIKLGAGASTL